MSGERNDSHPLLLRLHRALTSCSASIKSGDFKQSDESISDLVGFLNSITETSVSEPDNHETSASDALIVLMEIRQYITSPSLDQGVVDALSFELPKAAARFACVSQKCWEVAESIIDRLIEICSPRDMLSILCEALDSPSKKFKVSTYYAPLVSGLAKVFLSIQRRQFEQLNEAVPVILKVLKTILSEADEEQAGYEDLLKRSVDVASSIQSLRANLEGAVNEKLRALLCLYVLQIMAFVSFGSSRKVSSRHSLILQLSLFLRSCDQSYIGLITGCDVDKVTAALAGEDDDDSMSFFPYIKHGASLAVIWGYKSNDVDEAFAEDLAAVRAELSTNQMKRWQALDRLKNILTCVNLSWELKKLAIDFLLDIFDGKLSSRYDNELIESSFCMSAFFTALQAIEMVIIYAPDVEIKKGAFDAFKKVLRDIPASLRFDALMALINNSDSSSMIAILIDCVRSEMHMENIQQISIEDRALHVENNSNQTTSFWNGSILELVKLILRPPKGGPPSLPEFGDAVLSALNLYRFVLVTESTGNTNRTGVLSRANLQKAYSEWLLPLRALVSGIMAESQRDRDQLSLEVMCGLNPIELVLYRCIELVEGELRNTT